jgi:hypothetical protein
MDGWFAELLCRKSLACIIHERHYERQRVVQVGI